MPGLTWLRRGGVGAIASKTFVRSADERAVLTRLGVDPDGAIEPTDPMFSLAVGITIIRSGDWLVVLEQTAWPRGIRPDMLRSLSVGTEVVAIHEDIGKGNHQLAHAADGEIITAVTTTVPPNWGGNQPDRLRPLAQELGMRLEDGSPGLDAGLSDIEILLIIAEAAFGLSLDEADLNSPLLKVPDQPADPALRARGPAKTVDTELVRSHVRHLIDRGVSADTIAAHAGMPVRWIDRLLNDEVGAWMVAHRAERILAMEVPPQGAP